MTERQKRELIELLKQFTIEEILEQADAQIKILETALSKWSAFYTTLIINKDKESEDVIRVL